MIVDERGKPFKEPFDWSGGDAMKRQLDMRMREFLQPSPLLKMLELGRLRDVAEECQRWENKGTLPPAPTIKFKFEGRYE